MNKVFGKWVIRTWLLVVVQTEGHAKNKRLQFYCLASTLKRQRQVVAGLIDGESWVTGAHFSPCCSLGGVWQCHLAAKSATTKKTG